MTLAYYWTFLLWACVLTLVPLVILFIFVVFVEKKRYDRFAPQSECAI
jgi:hypothetical protein